MRATSLARVVLAAVGLSVFGGCFLLQHECGDTAFCPCTANASCMDSECCDASMQLCVPVSDAPFDPAGFCKARCTSDADCGADDVCGVEGRCDRSSEGVCRQADFVRDNRLSHCACFSDDGCPSPQRCQFEPRGDRANAVCADSL